MCRLFNKQNPIVTATPLDLNEDNEDDDTSDTVIAIRKQVSIEGGVSDEFLRNTIEPGAGMLLNTEGVFEGKPAYAE